MPFVSVVTYYPRFEDNSYLALTIRLFIFFLHYYYLFNMIGCDSLAIAYLILISMKFVTLRKYFDNLSNAYESKSKNMSKDELRKWFKLKCIEGLKMHGELIR